MDSQNFIYKAGDGACVYCYEWPVATPRGIVQIVHGGAEHARRYQHFAQALNDRGFVALAADNRGHGKTAGLNDGFGNMGPANCLENVCADVAGVTGWARDQYPGKPVVIFGHSIGSLITQRVLIDHGGSYAAAILSGSPSVDVLQHAKPAVEQALQQAGRDDPAEELQSAMFSSFMEHIADPRTPFDWLSRDPLEVDRYIEDEMCGFALTLGSWLDIAEAGPVTADPAAIASVPTSLPILIVSGGDDPAHLGRTATDQIYQQYRAAGVNDVRLKYFEGGRHELLNETNREEVISDLLSWIEEAVPAGS